MRETLIAILAGVLLGAPLVAPRRAAAAEPAARVRFETLEVFVDSGGQALAAYQFELAAEVGEVKIAGVEGGEHPAFKSPPYYDPAALSRNRIIIAAFNTGRDLPRGRTRVARLHLYVSGDKAPEYAVRLEAAGNAQGQRIPATVTVRKGEMK